MRNIFIILIPIIFFTSCLVRKVGGVNQFVTKPNKKNRKSNIEFQIDGAYVASINVKDTTSGHFAIWFLYSNGITLSYYCKIDEPLTRITKQTLINSINREILDEKKYSRKIRTAGGYVINGSKIKLQEYQIGHYGFYNLGEYNGIIINDTTINLSSTYFDKNVNDSFNTREKLLLHYLPMSKPDSINQWMNKKWYWAD